MRQPRGARGAKAKGRVVLLALIVLSGTSLWGSLRAASLAAPGGGDDDDGAYAGRPGGAPSPLCPHRAGARVAETLGISPEQRRALPIDHVVVLMQENRSFDHYFATLASSGAQPAAEGPPRGFSNPDDEGRPVAPFHLPTTCLPYDPPHQRAAMHAHWNGGRMDGFIRGGARGDRDGDDDDDDKGRFAMGYYDGGDLPFYHWLASTFALSDRYFSAAMGGTWPNRQMMYTGTAHPYHASTAMLLGTRSLFDALDDAGVAWRVFTDGPPRQDCIGWPQHARGVEGMASFLDGLASGTLPPVSFIDPYAEDEHPPADVQRGEQWARRLYLAVTASPLWPRLAVFHTYDEGGGFFDHVPPPEACPPDPTRPEYGRRGTRVPFVLVSPWARPHHVSHQIHDHASVLRFIELLFDLPALTDRDANADALLDMFDFSSPPRLSPPAPPEAGRGGCKPL